MKDAVTYKGSLRGALRGGLIAAGINTGWLFSLEYLLAIKGLPQGFAIAVVISSILPVLIGGLVYAVLCTNFQKGRLLYLILGSAFALFSIFPSFQPQLPDGSPTPLNFALLTVPMHFFAGAAGMYFTILQGRSR